jgi:hypothetical protein
MTAPAAAALINLPGYIIGSVSYAMLLVTALGRQSMASSLGLGGASTVELGLPINLANASVDGMTPRYLQQTSARICG